MQFGVAAKRNVQRLWRSAAGRGWGGREGCCGGDGGDGVGDSDDDGDGDFDGDGDGDVA